MNGSWTTSSREGVGSFSSEGECITYVMQGGTVFRLQSWNDTYVNYLGFNEAGSIIAISISNTSPSTSNPCGALVYVSIYNNSAFYITFANPGEQSTLYMPTPSPFSLNPDAPHHLQHPDDPVISGNFGMTIGIGPCN
jgi:hypothetical protein